MQLLFAENRQRCRGFVAVAHGDDAVRPGDEGERSARAAALEGESNERIIAEVTAAIEAFRSDRSPTPERMLRSWGTRCVVGRSVKVGTRSTSLQGIVRVVPATDRAYRSRPAEGRRSGVRPGSGAGGTGHAVAAWPRQGP